jgi:DDE family transposase
MVMRAAQALAERALPTYSSKFSRHDYTLAQLFACLVLREHQNKTYRGVEALLRDCPDWLADIGLSKAPDHNTLCRAFGVIVKLRRINRMLDVTAQWFTDARVLDLTRKPLAADSTHFESRHVSRHYERRRKQTAEKAGNEKPDQAGSFTRSGTSRKLPKATFAVAAACHLVLSVAVSTGAGSDAPSFDRLLYDAWRRAPVKAVVADAGFDSEKNHRIARLDMTVRSIIPPEIGRPRKDGGPPSGRFRRLMHYRFKRKADRKAYGQRWQSETVNSMIKRNLGSALRAKTPQRREREMLLRTITHNLMIV